MDVQQILSQVRDTLTVQRVFGEPYEKDGVTIMPVAALSGGGGGGSGSQGDEIGGGAGFGVNARPAGVYVIKGDDVRWVPAFDVNRAVIGGQIIGMVALLTLRVLIKAVLRAKERTAHATA